MDIRNLNRMRLSLVLQKHFNYSCFLLKWLSSPAYHLLLPKNTKWCSSREGKDNIVVLAYHLLIYNFVDSRLSWIPSRPSSRVSVIQPVTKNVESMKWSGLFLPILVKNPLIILSYFCNLQIWRMLQAIRKPNEFCPWQLHISEDLSNGVNLSDARLFDCH